MNFGYFLGASSHNLATFLDNPVDSHKVFPLLKSTRK